MTQRRLGRVAHAQLTGLLAMAEDPKKFGRTKKLQADDREALATWDAGAVERGFANAKEMLAAGPAPLSDTERASLSSETRAAMAQWRTLLGR